jgi:hypothetical protein
VRQIFILFESQFVYFESDGILNTKFNFKFKSELMFDLNMSKKDKRFSPRNTLLYKVIHNASKGMDPPMNVQTFETQIKDSINWALLLINHGINGFLSQPHIQ